MSRSSGWAAIWRIRDGKVEARVIRIPALYVMALWLKDLEGDKDVIVPMAPAPPLQPTYVAPPLAPEQIVSDLKKELKDAARAFTGWSLDRQTGQFVFRRFIHDDGEKTVLGRGDVPRRARRARDRPG